MSPAQHHMNKVARLGCVVCSFALGIKDTPAQLHHVAEGSGLRSDFAVVPLCPEHHTGTGGLHRMGQRFLSAYRVLGETEWGLLVWTNEALAKAELRRSGS